MNDRELRLEPQNEVEDILSKMAFRCAGGITHSGRKEYTPTLKQLYELLVSEAVPNPTTPAGDNEFIPLEAINRLFNQSNRGKEDE